ncbi:hypothetical protein RUM44_008315 [Polyplax serrata]|uniref:RGS domain-containing protein n=1 Tax=Polyplax serrata TaxID=468196 RepID=A0ABR1B801_POLSC
MLKFWKRTGQRGSSVTSGSSPTIPPPNIKNFGSPVHNGIGFPLGSFTAQIKQLEELIKEDPIEITSSRLSKTLVEVINDSEAFTYFIQYLETVGQGAMIKFILDVESFNSALSNVDSNSMTCSTQCSNFAIIENNLKDILISEINDMKLLNNESTDLSKFSNGDNGGDSSCDNSISHGNLSDQRTEDIANEGKDDLEENKLITKLLDCAKKSESSADAVKIFNKYFSHKAPLKINIDAGVYRRLLENLCTTVNKNTFVEVKQCILNTIEKEHFNDYLKSECHCKYQIDVLTSKKVCISDILFNEVALFYFMEFLEQEGCTSFVEFWMSALNFQQQYEELSADYNRMQVQNDAMVLYEKYFSLQATTPLNLGDYIRTKVEESICSEQGPLPNCFEYPRRLIVKFLEVNYFQAFLQSELYFKYLSELISTIQTSPLLGRRSRISGVDSDGSSDISISTTNTLLASEDPVSQRKLYRHFNSSSLSIDTQQLYDPDSLWQRGPKRPGLNFGRVNELGRFETDLEPEPDRKEESRITKAVKKLVNLNEDKSKEEMAWQVAAMIVRDVTNITMPPSTDS